MANPVPVMYNAAVSPIVAGRFHYPSWLPLHGEMRSIHANALSSVNVCPPNNCWFSESLKQNGPWTNWTGAVFAPDYSKYGAMVFWGGGHGGYSGTEYTIFDLETRLWSVIGAQVPQEAFDLADSVWFDIDVAGSLITPAVHTYNHPVYVPPAFGGGVKGSWLLTYNVEGGARAGIAPHAVNLSTGVSSRYTANAISPYYANGPYGGSFVDTKRNIVWLWPGHSSNATAKINLNNVPRTVEEVSGVRTPGYYFNPVYVEAADMVVAVWGDGPTIKTTAYDLASGTPVRFDFEQNEQRAWTHNGSGFGFDYCVHTGKFYLYEGYGATTIHVLTPPEDWKTGTWVWSTENIGGEAPVDYQENGGSQGQQPFNKWRYNPRLRVFMWSQGTVSRNSLDGVSRDGAFQIYRPLGV